MFCPKCGAKVKDGISFCSSCGEKVAPHKLESQEKPAAVPSSSAQSPKRVIIFLLIGLIIVGLAVGGYFWWQKTKESLSPEETGSSQTNIEKAEPSLKPAITEPLIMVSVVGLSLSQEDMGTSLKFDYADPKLNLKDEPGLASGLNQAVQVIFNNQNGESNLVNLVMRYDSIETAKTAYDFVRENVINELFGGTDVPKVPAETLTSQKFGNDSVVYKIVMPEEEGTAIICAFRRGNIIEIIAPAEQPLLESDVYKYAKILEEKINKAADNSSSQSNSSPTPSPELSSQERIKNAYDSTVRSNLRVLQIGLDQYLLIRGNIRLLFRNY